MQPPSLGRVLLTLAQLLVFPGSFLADFNETHVKNPLWPPHARFHNGQTMTLSLLLSGTALWYAWGSPSTERGKTGGDAQRARDLWIAAWVGSFYCLAGLSAIWYPDTAWMDVEFRKQSHVDEPVQLWGGLRRRFSRRGWGIGWRSGGIGVNRALRVNDGTRKA